MKIIYILILLLTVTSARGLEAGSPPDTNSLTLVSVAIRINAMDLRNQQLARQLTEAKKDIRQVQTGMLILLIGAVAAFALVCFKTARRTTTDFKPSVPYAPGDKVQIGSTTATITHAGKSDQPS